MIAAPIYAVVSILAVLVLVLGVGGMRYGPPAYRPPWRRYYWRARRSA